MSDEDWEEYIASPYLHHGMSAYVFRCFHCGTVGGYWEPW